MVGSGLGGADGGRKEGGLGETGWWEGRIKTGETGEEGEDREVGSELE